MQTVRRFAVGAESTADYAMTRDIETTLTFGYEMIDAGRFGDSAELRRALEEGVGKWALSNSPDRSRLSS